MASDTAILVVSCDRYNDLWGPFFHCFFKYWSDCPYPVYLGANTLQYPDPRVRTIAVGADEDYSSNLIEMLRRVESEWVILWIEDRPLSRPLDCSRLARLIELAKNKNVGFMKLISCIPYALDVVDDQEVGEIPAESLYRVSMTVGLWRKDVLLKLLRPGENAWQIERLGSKRSAMLAEPFVSLAWAKRRNPPIAETHLIVKGRLIRAAIPFLRQEGLLTDVAGRPLQSWGSCLYVRMYIIYFALINSLQWRWMKMLSYAWCYRSKLRRSNG